MYIIGLRQICNGEIFMDKDKLSIFAKIPTLETDRLVLRKMLTRDAADMFEYASRPEVSEYLLWNPHTTQRFTKNYLHFLQSQYGSKNFYDWAVTLRSSEKMIGTCGFTSFDLANNSAEVGYVLSSSYWGQGIAPEALKKVIDFGFRVLRLHRIYARIMDGNTRSETVAKKCGMTLEATMRDLLYVKGAYRTIKIYSVLETD